MTSFSINGRSVELDADPATPILWIVREQLGLNGTKFGCGIAQCGACTVHLDGRPIRSCSTPLSAAEGKNITTVEGLKSDDGTLHKVQQAWIEAQVPQCGYCQSGQIMSAIALLERNPQPSDEQIDAAMAGNVCRCGMYGRIRTAIKSAAGISQDEGAEA
ncbi:(2Fe-2S)-binding protein [Erythrobacter sp. YT30]|uniref:(2Fe-2S)-binding protein n=1 Tax=Erythrobacter sp. YT30 TaxID=1735012 RepID=UPI00076D8B64|nr:(2Fe-2S)-binding protein [Erythrobacter sp. YT30]KWV90815.1 hypothetical protein AUC45_05560 [Erythrobacter sp. YT30]